MGMREKLIELLDAIQLRGEDFTDYEIYGMRLPNTVCNDDVADHLIANGVTVLPCKVGQEAWVVYTPKHPANQNDKGKWFMVQDGVQRIIYGAKGVSIETWNMGTIPGKEIGKKLFFTREEAEVALRERRTDVADK